MSSQPLRIIVTGLIGQHPHMGGVAWDYLQYPLGLKLLGHDVYYFEDSGEWPYNLDGGESGDDWVARDPGQNLRHLQETMERIGLADRWAYRFPLENSWFGMSDQRRKAVVASADLLINVSGTLEHPENYRDVERMAYIDSDPLFTQIKFLKKLPAFSARIDLHEVHFSFGECFSEDMPSTGHRWLPTRHPMVLDQWHHDTAPREAFTTVMNWTSYPPLTYQDKAYGQKDVEFKRFLQLPSKVAPVTLEVALAKTEHVNWQTRDLDLPTEIASFLDDHPHASPAELLTRTGWNVVDPEIHCSSLDAYRDYIISSKAEWSVAKNGYVAGKPGWFSCRSSCYLAAGRPVVVQDTGFQPVLPTGEGILVFSEPETAAEAIREVDGNYHRHARAAREIAQACFDSGKVLSRLIEDAFQAPSKNTPNQSPAESGAMEPAKG